MAIRASYERHPDLGCEAVVFLDEESDGCFQIQRDLPGGPRADEYCVTTGASAPVYGGVLAWRCVPPIEPVAPPAEPVAPPAEPVEASGGTRFEFHLAPRAARLFGDDVLSFEVVTDAELAVGQLAEHVDRLLR